MDRGTATAPPGADAPDAGRSAGQAIAAAMAAAYVALVVPLALVGSLVAGARPPGIDGAVTRRLGAWRGGALDPISSGVSQLTDPMLVIVTTVGVVSVLLALRRSALAVALLVALPLELAVFLTVTVVVDRARPDIALLDPEPVTASFPSGHAAAAVALYGTLAWIVHHEARSPIARRLALTVALVVPVGVGWARVHRGMHHLTDVLAGGVLGAATLAVGIACARLAESRGVDEHHR